MRVRLSSDGGDASPGLNADPHFASLTLDDGTGITITAPSAAAIFKHASLLLAGPSFGCTLDGTTGYIKIVRKGLYRVRFHLSDLPKVNSQVLTFELYVNDAVVAAGIRAKLTQIGTAAVDTFTLAAEGIVALNKGDTVSLYVKASTGDVVAKSGRIEVCQLTDVAVTPTL